MNPFETPLKTIQTRISAALPAITAKAGNIVLKHTAFAFRDQGFTDETLTPWEPRNPDHDPGRAVLIKTGRLRRSIRVISQTNDTITIGTDVPYAQAHNEGFKGSVTVPSFTRKIKTIKGISGSTVKEHTRNVNMPQRKFLGNSAVQSHAIKSMIRKEIAKCFRIVT